MWATSMFNHHLSTCGIHPTVFRLAQQEINFVSVSEVAISVFVMGVAKDSTSKPSLQMTYMYVYNAKNGDNTIHQYPNFPSQDLVTHTTMLTLTAYSIVGLTFRPVISLFQMTFRVVYYLSTKHLCRTILECSSSGT